MVVFVLHITRVSHNLLSESDNKGEVEGECVYHSMGTKTNMPT